MSSDDSTDKIPVKDQPFFPFEGQNFRQKVNIEVKDDMVDDIRGAQIPGIKNMYKHQNE